jgi:predicted DNA-binding transcriptional regulator YafY
MDTPARLLRLLALLPARATWPASELAERLEVTERTVRRDVQRLRALGYPIAGTTGPYGGYALGAGGRLPPLVLDDDEAVAVAIGLRAGAGGATGVESAALSALTKLDGVLPAVLRERIGALRAVTVGLGRGGPPPVDIDALVVIAIACRRPERLRFTYQDANDRVTDRLVEPYRVVFTQRSWYLVAHDAARDDWRTFRVDRMRELALAGTRFTHRDTPDAAGMVAEGMAVGAHELQARVRLDLPLADAQRLVPRTVGILEPGDGNSTIARIGGDAEWIATFVAGLECGVEVLEPPVVRAAVRRIGLRLARDHR